MQALFGIFLFIAAGFVTLNWDTDFIHRAEAAQRSPAQVIHICKR